MAEMGWCRRRHGRWRRLWWIHEPEAEGIWPSFDWPAIVAGHVPDGISLSLRLSSALQTSSCFRWAGSAAAPQNRQQSPGRDGNTAGTAATRTSRVLTTTASSNLATRARRVSRKRPHTKKTARRVGCVALLPHSCDSLGFR